MSDSNEGPARKRGGMSSVRADDRAQTSFLDDFLGSILAVLGIGLLLFAISGVWPPMVAIESPSMEPNIDTGDLVFVMQEERFSGPNEIVHGENETGVVPVYQAQDAGYSKFNLPGDVIVYEPDGDSDATPVIHRAIFWVNKSEDWYNNSKAQDKFLPEDRQSCADLEFCPAPHAGFITLGDNNGQYDQVAKPRAVSGPVRPEWVIGTAEFRMPIIGRLRLGIASLSPTPTVEAATLAVS